MLRLPVDVTVPCPPFTYVGINLAKLFEVLREKAGMATRRTLGLMKLGTVLYVCLNTKGSRYSWPEATRLKTSYSTWACSPPTMDNPSQSTATEDRTW